MNISIVVPVLNEEKTISSLINSLCSSSSKFGELIIIDGGSTDQTAEIVKKYSRNVDFKVTLLKKRGNIAVARNYGILKAKYETILLTDAGCIVDKKWIERMSKLLENENNLVVAGRYKMAGKSDFQIAIKRYLGVDKFDESFIPSARSVAFKKSVWKKVGKFDEKLYRTAEDTHFFYKVIKSGFSIITSKDAYVNWLVPKNAASASDKFFWYAFGDAQSGIWWHPEKRFKTHNMKVISVYLRYIFFATILSSNFFIFLIAMAGYSFWASQKNSKYSYKIRLNTVFIQYIADVSVMCGFLSGLISNKVYN